MTGKPGTVSLPTTSSSVVIRISNPQALVNHETRVENEVAAMMLMRDALSAYISQIVPQVYDWTSASPANTILGYILQEYKPGVGLDTTFGLGGSSDQESSFQEFDSVKKQDLLRQIAEVLKLIQSYKLPPTVKGYGGLRFDEAARIITGPTTIPCGGPFMTYPEMYAQMLQHQLGEADRNTELVRGWRTKDRNTGSTADHNDLRDRLDTLATAKDGIARIVEENSVQRPTLVHGDFGE